MTPFQKGLACASGLWMLGMGSCAATPTIKTWIIGDTDLTESSTGAALTFLAAKGYRCYSQSDDEFWRNALATAQSCCASN